MRSKRSPNDVFCWSTDFSLQFIRSKKQTKAVRCATEALALQGRARTYSSHSNGRYALFEQHLIKPRQVAT
jgi:hypothetical protein